MLRCCAHDGRRPDASAKIVLVLYPYPRVEVSESAGDDRRRGGRRPRSGTPLSEGAFSLSTFRSGGAYATGAAETRPRSVRERWATWSTGLALAFASVMAAAHDAFRDIAFERSRRSRSCYTTSVVPAGRPASVSLEWARDNHRHNATLPAAEATLLWLESPTNPCRVATSPPDPRRARLGAPGRRHHVRAPPR